MKSPIRHKDDDDGDSDADADDVDDAVGADAFFNPVLIVD